MTKRAPFSRAWGTLFLLACASACVAPDGRPRAAAAAKPGWGSETFSGQAVTSVRAVEAAARPTVPPRRSGKPGWGR